MVSRATSRCSNTTVAVAHESDRGMKLMGAPAQGLELLAGGHPIGGLGKPSLAERQGLVGAQHQPAGPTRRDRPRLLAGEHRRDLARIAGGSALLDRSLVDIGGLDLDGNSRVAQNCVPDRAFRREHERLLGEPKRHRSRP